MSDSNKTELDVGFSTGALARNDFRAAMRWLRNNAVHNVELSALRYDELKPLVESLDDLETSSFAYVSFHAPSAFPRSLESQVVDLLKRVADRGWNIIVHPDVIYDFSLWRPFGCRLLLENMDRRKPVGRTAEEMALFFESLPEARFCLDLAHARQLDSTLTVLTELLERFSSRVAEIHISELDSRCSHQIMSLASMLDYTALAEKYKLKAPAIIESMLELASTRERLAEFEHAKQVMCCSACVRYTASYYIDHFCAPAPESHYATRSRRTNPTVKPGNGNNLTAKRD